MTILTDKGVLHVVVQRLRSVQPDANRPWGRMSVGGMLCHLNDAFVGVLSLRASEAAAGNQRGSLAGQLLLRPFALHVSIRWPHRIPTPPEADQLIGGTPPAEFIDDKERLICSVQLFAGTDMGGVAHPIFGRLSQWEWMRWGWLHVDHHLRQFSA